MNCLGLHHCVAGFGACLGVDQGGQENPTIGRQEKSAACGRAHVVGLVDDFRHFKNQSCWRFAQNIQRFQSLERHRLPSEMLPPT